jgi:hypothetical protein
MQLRAIFLVCSILAVALAQFDDIPVNLPKLRGIDKIGVGIDLVTLQLKMSPIQLTWQGKSFTNPYDDKDYEIPWEIDSISTPDTFTNQTTNVYDTVNEFRTERARSTGISLNLGNLFSFSNTKETRQIKYTLDNKGYKFGVTELRHIFFDVKLFPPFLLQRSNVFNQFLQRLPRYSKATKAQWFQLFDYFGTHYVREAQLGGSIRREEIAYVRNFTRLDENYIKKQFSISFNYGTTPASPAPATNTPTNNPTANVTTGTELPMNTVANPNALGKRHQHRSTEDAGTGISFGFSFNKMREDLRRQLQIRYTSKSSVQTRLIGGNPTLFEPDQWRDWVQTIVKNPTIITYQLGSILDLITDKTKKADMKQAILDRNNTPR